MKILPLSNNSERSRFNFKRMPRAKELPVYKKTIDEGLRVLNKELGIIIHNSSVPSKRSQNVGIGSLLSKTSEAFFVPFLRNHGFSSIQQDPNYKRRKYDPSPYDPISTSKNIYMIPLEKLETEEYGFLLASGTIAPVLVQDDTKVNYPEVDKNYEKILRNAYSNFKELKFDAELQEDLKKSFSEFLSLNYDRLEPNAVYEILAKQYNSEDWKTWDEVDKNLYDDPDLLRLKEIKKNNSEDIEFHIFKQWLIEREIGMANKRNNELGIKVIADTPIAFTPTEEWLNKDLFLDDLALGCPPDYYSADGQRWGFAVLNPKKIFNPDGTLGKGGKFLQKRYEDIFANAPGGVRIDHLIGLIDPFVYKESEPKMNESNSGRLYSSPDKDLFREYTKYTEEEYLAILKKIIFPAAEKYGVSKDKIICEDLGYLTDPVKNAIYKLNLTGMSITQYGASGYDAPARNVIMLGGHDNKSFIEYTDEFFKNKNDYFYFRTHILGSDTSIPNLNVDKYREDIRNDKKKFLMASFTELFTSPAKKVQIFFTDFFGIGKTYNVPGTKKGCWTLRLNSDFEKLYYENLEKGLAINLPEVIANAIRRKGKDFVATNQNLLIKLDYFTKIFKE